MPRRPRRRDLYDADFRSLCDSLAAATSPFRPDLVVGIETGGARVAEVMLAPLDEPAFVSVRLQRPATKLKSRFRVGSVVSRLPRGVADALRWLEVESRELMVGRRPSDLDRDAQTLIDGSDLAKAAAPAQRILVVDDTIDSGRTLSVVRRAAELVAPGAEVRTAVLASAWHDPPVRADWCLLERTLLRMPWSLDASRPA